MHSLFIVKKKTIILFKFDFSNILKGEKTDAKS